MKVRTVLLLLVVVLVAAFTALNWSAFMAPTTLSLGFTVMEAPLGMVMLGMIVLLTVIFLIFAFYIQTTYLLEAHRHAKELQVHRELADKAEASRFTELRGFLEAGIKQQEVLDAASRAALLTRLDRLENDVRAVLGESTNTITAHVGELEDRLARGTKLAPGSPA